MNRKRLLISLLLVFAVFLPMSIFAEEDYLNYYFKKDLNAQGTVKLYVDKEFEHFIVAGNGKMDPKPDLGMKIWAFYEPIYAGSIDFGWSTEKKNEFINHAVDIMTNGYVLEIKPDVQLPDDCTDFFRSSEQFPYIKEIIFPENFDTSNVTNMSYMFCGQEKLKTLDVSNWDTSNVTDMSGMFLGATNANPDVSNWNTSNVTNMKTMFGYAENANPDVSKWDTSNVRDMSNMFNSAKKANPDVSNWNMSKVEDISNMFDESGIIELDLRKWDPYSIFKNNYSDLMNCPNLQYIYLSTKSPLISEYYYSNRYGASSFKKQKDNNAREDVLSDGYGDSFEFENTGADTIYFIPQETSLNVVWKDNDNEKGFRPDKQKVKLLANGKDISAPMTIPQGENPVVLNDSNSWQHGYSDLDIFNGGKKIDYTVKAEDLDDYITDYVFKKEGTVLYSSQKGKIEDQAPGFTIINTYMTIAEEKPLGEKPRVPKNFVKVTVDTTDKASSDTHFKRAFWVTPNVELELPVVEPTGKSDQAHKYTFEGWKGLEPSALKWNKGEKIKAKFTSETTIEAQYKDENKQKPPKPPVVDPKDNEDKPQEPPVIEDTRRPKYRDTRDTNKTISASKTFNETITVKANEETHTAYIKGYPDGTFRPEKSITRAEAITMLVGLKGYPLIEARETYKDVDKNKWYAPYIDAAYREGILEEKEGENFRPDENIKRGELAQIISHIDKKNDAKAPFTDIEGYKYKKAIDQSYGNKRIMGYPDNTFRPNAEITRAETVAMLNRLFERCVREEGLENVEISKFKDLQDKSYWAYYEIIEASQTHTFARINQNTVEEVWKTIIK